MKTTYEATLPSGQVRTRRSRGTYSHALVGLDPETGEGFVVCWFSVQTDVPVQYRAIEVVAQEA